MSRRVVVTGLGTVNPLGIGVKETWESCVAGKSGFGFISLFDASSLNVKIGAEVKNFNPVIFMDATLARYTDRFTQFALAASREALEESGMIINDENCYQTGIVIGSGIGGIGTLSNQMNVMTPTTSSGFSRA